MPDSRPRDRNPALDERRSLDIEESRVLRRRLAFWRSVAGLLVLTVLLAAALFQVRRNAAIERCRVSLEHYAKLATAVRLDQFDPGTLGARWRGLDQGQAEYDSSHYHPLIANWSRTTKPNEETPLAVCSTEHGGLFGGGRQVLFRTTSGLVVRWVESVPAQELSKQAVESERTLNPIR